MALSKDGEQYDKREQGRWQHGQRSGLVFNPIPNLEDLLSELNQSDLVKLRGDPIKVAMGNAKKMR
jgi:hypothetical protein